MRLSLLCVAATFSLWLAMVCAVYGIGRYEGSVRILNIKAMGVGFLANMTVWLTFLLIIYLCIATVGIFYTTVDGLARARVEGEVLGDGSAIAIIGESLWNTTQNALHGIWGTRLGFLIFGVIGIFAAWAHQIGLALDPKRVWLFSFVAIVLVTAVGIIAWGLSQREAIALWMAESPELFRWRDMLVRSYSLDISVGLILAMTISYPIWITWRWWYTRFSSWLLSKSEEKRQHRPSRTSQQQVETGNHRSYSNRLHELKKGLDEPKGVRNGSDLHSSAKNAHQTNPALRRLTSWKVIVPIAIVFGLCIALIPPVQSYHNQVAVRLQHDTAFVNADTEAALSFPITILPGDGRIRVVNIKGLGTISIYLSSTEDIARAILSIDDWTFEYRLDEYIYNEMSFSDVEPGTYYLHFVQESGWGWFEYTLSQGGGRASNVLALAFGIFMALAVVLGLVMLLLVGTKVVLTLRPESF